MSAQSKTYWLKFLLEKETLPYNIGMWHHDSQYRSCDDQHNIMLDDFIAMYFYKMLK